MPVNPFTRNAALDDRSDPFAAMTEENPFSAFIDTNPDQYARRAIDASNMAGGVNNSMAWQRLINKQLSASPRNNPYSMEMGNAARASYEAALDQLHNGTSVVQGEANQAMGQVGQQVAGAVAGGSGLSQALGAGAGATGLADVAGQAGNARLAEFMNQQAQYGQGLNAMRGQDLGQAAQSQQAGLQQRAQDDALMNFYSNMGANLRNQDQQLATNRFKTFRRTAMDKDAKNWDSVGKVVQAGATVAKLAAGGL